MRMSAVLAANEGAERGRDMVVVGGRGWVGMGVRVHACVCTRARARVCVCVGTIGLNKSLRGPQIWGVMGWVRPNAS